MGRIPRRGARAYKACGCGKIFTRAAWQALRLVGLAGDDVVRLELRDCDACRSTIDAPTALVRVSYAIEAVEGGLVVWRRAGAAEEIALGRGPNARVYETTLAAKGAIEIELAKDRAAARRLGIEIVGDDHGEPRPRRRATFGSDIGHRTR